MERRERRRGIKICGWDGRKGQAQRDWLVYLDNRIVEESVALDDFGANRRPHGWKFHID